MTAREHYDNLLAGVYTWMLGDLETKVAEQKDFFMRHKVFPHHNQVAFDLGAGNGIQSIALAGLGFRVNAVDFNRKLLSELGTSKKNLPVSTTEDDILNFLAQTPESPELIVCMGDTLTHLSNFNEVNKLIGSAATVLSSPGKLILSWRDLHEERQAIERFIHVRSDDNRTMSCFLEYFPEHVMVYDLVTEKTADGWIQKVGCYPKLRLSVGKISHAIGAHGLSVIVREVNLGMTFIIAEKTGPK